MPGRPEGLPSDLNRRLGKPSAPGIGLPIGFLVMLPPAVDPRALRDARVRANLTQHDAARRVGVAGGERISRWELGTSEPRPSVLKRLAEVYGVGVDELLTACLLYTSRCV